MTTVESVGLLAVSSPLSRVMLPGPGGGGGGWLLLPPPSLFLSTTAVTADNLTIWCCLFLFMTKLVILWDDYQHRIIIFNIQYLENKTFLWQSIIMPSLAIQCYDDYLTGSVDSRFWTKQDMQRSRRCISVSPPSPPGHWTAQNSDLSCVFMAEESWRSNTMISTHRSTLFGGITHLSESCWATWTPLVRIPITTPGSTTTSIYYKLESSRLGGFDLLYFTIQWCISDAVFLLCRHLLAFNCNVDRRCREFISSLRPVFKIFTVAIYSRDVDDFAIKTQTLLN